MGPAERFELSSQAHGRDAAWPQVKVERHSGIGHELVLALDGCVLQMGDWFVDTLQFFRTPVVAEQVVEVPKLLLEDSIPRRIALWDPLLVE